jgi:hypothetical protein
MNRIALNARPREHQQVPGTFTAIDMAFHQFQQMTEAEDQRAAELYRLGFSQPEVARVIGRSRKAVRQALARSSIAPRSRADGYREWIARARGRGNRAKPPARSVFELSA